MPEIYQPADDSYLLLSVLEKIIPSILHKRKNLKFLEIGAGSGVQLQKLLQIGIKKENIFSCDINKDAVEHCKSLGFNSIHSDLFSNIKGKFDIIIFNPPYLPEDIREPLNSKISTTGGKKGGEIINKFLRQAKKHISEKGRIIMLTSSLTKGLNFEGYKTKIIAEKPLFFEKLYILELSL